MLAVCASAGKTFKYLQHRKVPEGTGLGFANEIFDVLNEWSLVAKTKALCFDTCSVNTGINNGACKHLKELIGRPILELACRHHILELILSHLIKKFIEPNQVGPVNSFFKKLVDNWDKLDAEDYSSALDDEEIYIHLKYRSEIIKFIKYQLKLNHSREDYKELLKLYLIYLGEERFEISRPGVLSHARFIHKLIYSLKIYLLRENKSTFIQQLN